MAETKKAVYHVSTYEIGRFKDGAWHCVHGDPAVENTAGTRSTCAGMRFWACDRTKHSGDECRFYLWEDHLDEAINYHNIPEDIAAQVRRTPSKRKRDGDIRDFYRSPKTPRTPRTPRTRAIATEAAATNSPTPVAAGPSNTRRELSPSPLPKETAKPMQPPPPPQPPRTPTSKSRATFSLEERPKPPAFELPPSPNRRRLTSPELKAYNVVIKSLSAERVGLTLKGQNALREIIKEESYWMQ